MSLLDPPLHALTRCRWVTADDEHEPEGDLVMHLLAVNKAMILNHTNHVTTHNLYKMYLLAIGECPGC